ncbi:MAG: bifunctional glutamate N-acetyltransferase/amino-acid acetyltransferase ArgJ [Chloroflexi bacterium]|nr:bifunctional glutamate N-acetyltransferase/amino-acid acetyltransferase ArgJ [Chloroflexota bacterium]
MTPKLDPAGNVTTAPGFRAGGTFAGIKTAGEGKLDLGILAADFPCVVAATFTQNRFRSAAVEVNVEHLADARARAVVVNSGCANSSTGERGMADAREMAALVAAKLGIASTEVLVGSTGVIGQYLPMDKIAAGVSAISLAHDGGSVFSRAIMTTDTRPKHGAVRFGPYTLGGCCKGAAMIHPNMATMLAYLTTDAPVEPGFLRAELRAAVDRSFNMVAIDTDTSPSDTVLLFARDPAGQPGALDAKSPLAAEFRAALQAMCTHLAREIARDGEGSTRMMEATVTGAASEAEARNLARLLTTSYLLKSAVHGADPNWGRISAVIGRSGAAFDEADVTIDLCGARVFERSRPTDFDPAAVSAAMRAELVPIAVSLGNGPGTATAWGCDLTPEYVHLNADYTT